MLKIVEPINDDQIYGKPNTLSVDEHIHQNT